MGWVLVGYGLAMGWLSAIDLLAIGYLLAGHQLASGFTRFLAIGWLLPQINTLQEVVIYDVPKLHMAAINTLGCSVFTRFFDYRLAIGWP